MGINILRGAHSSGQFSDTPAQQRHDAQRLASRMADRQWHFLTGTEATSRSVLAKAWKGIDQNYGLRFSKGRVGDVWVVTRKDLFEGEVDVQWHKIVNAVAGKHVARGYLRVTGHCPLVRSNLTILSSHWNTDAGDHHMANGPDNRKLADAAERLGEKYGAGKNLAFLGLDANRQEHEHGGIVLDAPYVSLAHEVGPVQNTGHGAIDALCRYQNDRRVKGRRWKVYDDSEFHLDSDHFLCEGTWTVEV